MRDERFDVEGMTCASCALTVEKTVGALQGVHECTVNLATETLRVTFDDSLLSKSQIIAAVSAAGYQAKEHLTGVVDEVEHRDDTKRQLLKRRLAWSSVFTVPLFYLAMGPMVGLPLPQPLAPDNIPLLFAMLLVALTLPVMVVNADFYHNGFRRLIKEHPNMDTLVAMGTSAAFLYSCYNTYRIGLGEYHHVHHLYYESVAVILTLMTLGNYLEHLSKKRASQAIKAFLTLSAKEATVLCDHKEVRVPVDALVIGDHILVKPGEKIAVDGVILSGTSLIDESLLTGEAIPVDKQPGELVYAGSINGPGALVYEATKIGSETFLAQIVKMVEEAQETKAPIARLADRVSGYFVPFVIGLSLVTGFLWYSLGGEDLSFAITVSVAILVIACPCALGLATPTAIMVGTGRAAEEGIFFKGGDVLEQTHRVDTVVFDKTGTLTKGQPVLSTVLTYGNANRVTLLADVASLEALSEHPLSQAVVAGAGEVSQKVVTDFSALSGFGLSGKVDGKAYLVGNPQLLLSHEIAISQAESDLVEVTSKGQTPILVACEGTLVGLLTVSDSLKADSKETVLALQQQGCDVILLTGDNDRTARAIAKEVGITTVYSQVLPQDKAAVIRQLQEEGRCVAMVGDGINDAPALALADVGIAMGSGTDLALASADVILLKPDTKKVLTSLALSRATIRVIKQNLFWAFFYNVLAIPVAMGILYVFGGPLLDPMLAGLAMSFSSVSVIVNSLRLKK